MGRKMKVLPPYLNHHLAKVPRIVQENLKSQVAQLKASGARVLLYLDPLLTLNLWARGTFADVNVLGAVTKHTSNFKINVRGLPIYSFGEMAHLKADAIIVSDYRFHQRISEGLLPLSQKYGFSIVDICQEFDAKAFRREWAEEMTRQIFSNEVEGWPARQVEIWIPPTWGLGDRLCALSAAREFARRNPERRVRFQYLPEIIEAYGDDLIMAGSGGYVIPSQYPNFYRDPDNSVAENYLGCFYLNIGLDFDTPPTLELPQLPPCPDLKPGSYIALQPRSVWANPNITSEQLEAVVQKAPLPVVVVGRPDTPRDMPSADFGHLGTPIEMLRIIQHAAFLMTPRSASANIGAAYDVSTLLWVPDDGANWQLAYPGWDYRTVRIKSINLVDRLVREMIALQDRIESKNNLAVQSTQHCGIALQSSKSFMGRELSNFHGGIAQ